jgi:hypothetical protein
MTQRWNDEVRQAFSAFIRAMKDGDTAALQALTSTRFTLTHMTGYVQPLDEWLAEIDTGKFVYYSIETRGITVSETGDQLVAQTLTDARVYGGRNTWKLQLAMVYARHEGRWIADRAVASIWK